MNSSNSGSSSAAPRAEMLLMGTTDGFANIHAPNERMLLANYEAGVRAGRALFGALGEALRA